MKSKRTTGLLLALTGGLWLVVADAAVAQVPTTLQDFFQPGSQPTGGVTYDTFLPSSNCKNCHETDGTNPTLIYPQWQGSMMAQAARDPMFFACLTIANQDAAFAGDLCLRCHTPGGWIQGRSDPPDGSALISPDFDGVNCSACHRMVDPVYKPGISPPLDVAILADVDPLPLSPGGANYVLDPFDISRGPRDDGNTAQHAWLESPFHKTSDLCGTCHDVGNPVFLRQPDGTYALTPLDEPHPTANKYDMFPLERTFSEWLHSDFANGGVDMGGRFGGILTVVSTCQDCHMPKYPGTACNVPGAPARPDLASHALTGANAWALQMVLNLYPNDGLNPAYIEDGRQRAIALVQAASTLEVTQTGNHIKVRVTNESGHKLPSGYPEGRRIWLNVRVSDATPALIEERGHYDNTTADLTTGDTKVYQAKLGVDATISAATGVPEGESFHFALNNVMIQDNRIPPRGFTNENYVAVQASPVRAVYADGQYWDETLFRLPAGADSATVRLWYQSASKEYVTFLRDENHTDSNGLILYNQWELTGKSPPIMMAEETLALTVFTDGDDNGDGNVDLVDYTALADCLSGPGTPYSPGTCSVFDFDEDGDVDLWDHAEFWLVFDG
ncbi:MAG: hypothetical protein GY778_03430 [bacterium]|nr:hypothetical protein [bacterium]